MAWTLRGETFVGLPRSNLVKKSAPPAASRESSRAANSFEAAKTILHPFEVAPPTGVHVVVAEAIALGDDATIDESLPRDAILPTTAFAPLPEIPSADDSDPSAASLLERAARRDPMRMTWESIIVQDDPILDAKREPRVAERRAQFRKVVKATLGGCVALCIAALTATAIAGGSDRAEDKVAGFGKTAPATAVVSIEKLNLETRTRASSTARNASNVATSRALPSSARRQSTRPR